MACALTSGYALDCRDSLGGVHEVYFIAKQDITGYTASAGVISDIAKAVGKGFYKYELVKATSSWVENINSSVENGSVFYQQELTVILNKMQASSRNEIMLLAKNLLVAVVKDNNGKFWLLGKERGMDLTAGSGSSGVAEGDRNGYSLTFVGKEAEMAYEVSAGEAASLETVGA